MTWARLDDHFPFHRKIRPLSDAAFRLHVSAICWANAHLTDGRVPADELPLISDVRQPMRSAAELVRRSVWTETAGGWQIHDFTIYNPTAEKVAAVRAKRADAGSRGGAKTAANRQQSAEQSADTARPVDNSRPRTDLRIEVSEVETQTRRSAAQDSSKMLSTLSAPSRPVVVVTSENQSQLGDAREKSDDDDLDRIINLLAGLRPRQPIDRTWAAKIRDTTTLPPGVANPAAYLLTVIENNPDRFLPKPQPEPFKPSRNPTGPPAADTSSKALAARRAMAPKEASA